MPRLEVSAVDYHTAGEPFRIVSGGVPPLRGRTILDKRRDAAERLDHVRRLLVNEPRGHADMYGGFVTEPEDGADLGVVFFHNAGYSTACGHGTIALVTWALEAGVVPITGEQTRVVVDVPSGRLVCTAVCEGPRVRAVRFRNVPAFVEARGLAVEAAGRTVPVDLAFGGAFYAVVDAAAVGLDVVPAQLPDLIRVGREIKQVVEGAREVVHPEQPELRDVYGVIFVEDDEPGDEAADVHQRNVAIFADGEVDRSPTGSGTSARLALLHADGRLGPDAVLHNRSIVGTVFTGAVVGPATVAGRPAVVTEIAGSAHLCGYHHFVLTDSDPLGTGFLLR